MKTLYIYLSFLFIIFTFSASYSQVIPDFKVNDDQGNSYQGGSAIAADANGNFVITWDDERNGISDIYAQRYSSNGVALGSNFRVNVNIDSMTSRSSSNITIDTSGNFVITWADGYDEGRYTIADIYAQPYSNDGIALGNNFKVNDSIEIDCGFPAISSDANGNFVITWGDCRHGDFAADIYAQRYSSAGVALGSNFKVNSDTGNTHQYDPCVATDRNGNFVIAWYDTKNGGYDIFAQRYSSDGTPLSDNFKVTDGAPTAWNDGPSISTDANGNFIIAWTDFRNGTDIYAQRYSSDGVAQGNNFKVNGDGTSGLYASVSSDTNGNFVITWVDNQSGNGTLYAQRYLSDGSPLGDYYKVTSTDSSWTFRGTDFWNGLIYTTWRSDSSSIINSTGSDVWANVLDWNNPVHINPKRNYNIPSGYILYQNYPNPFNPTTNIQFSIPKTEIVSLKIYNLLGQEVKTLVSNKLNVGNYSYTWDATGFASGIYYYTIMAGDPSISSGQRYVKTKKLILIK